MTKSERPEDQGQEPVERNRSETPDSSGRLASKHRADEDFTQRHRKRGDRPQALRDGRQTQPDQSQSGIQENRTEFVAKRTVELRQSRVNVERDEPPTRELQSPVTR